MDATLSNFHHGICILFFSCLVAFYFWNRGTREIVGGLVYGRAFLEGGRDDVFLAIDATRRAIGVVTYKFRCDLGF
jgi:hypothetical protein